MKSKSILIFLLSVIAITTVLFTGFLVWKYDESFNLGGEVAELDSVYISDTENAQLQTQQDEPIDINEDVNQGKVGELSLNENRKVVQFSDDLTDEEKEQLEEDYNIEFTSEESVKGTYSVITTEDSKVTELQEDEKVSTVETDIPIKMFDDTIDWGVTRVGASQVWEEGSGTGITVAIIDTGIQLNHPDLGGNVVSGYDFVNGDSSANDDNGHGTHVAGIVASTLNGAGNVGTSHSARLMPVKVLNESGYGYLSDVAKGIY
jgi:subtilisin family serine protease